MENSWYSPYEEKKEEPAVPAAPAPAAKRPHRALKYSLIALSLLLLIGASCLIFREREKKPVPAESHGFSFSWTWPGSGNGGFHFGFPGIPGLPGEGESDPFSGDAEEFFENYYSSYEEAEDCLIPRAETSGELCMELHPAEGEPMSIHDVYARCAPSIVAVAAYPEEDNDDVYGWGSGVILTEDGYIITNAHVVEGARRGRVTLYDNREFEAMLVGSDSRSDIAVLKIEAEGLPAAEFGRANELEVGDDVAAIGNPLGSDFRSTLTNGIISGIDRDVAYNGTTRTLIQTNAAINEGNSGGALINMYGQVVGITNMKMSSGGSIGAVTIEGVGFAIPSETVKEMAEALFRDGAVLGRPALGITVGPIPRDAAEHYELPEGLYVSIVAEGSDCYKQGLRTGDIVTHVDGEAVSDTAGLTGRIAGMEVGDSLLLRVYRDGESFDMTVKLVDVNDVY